MDPEDILRKLRAHLDSKGFSDIKIAWHEVLPPAKTPADDPFVKVVVKANQKVFGHKIILHPTSPASGPLSYFKGYVPMVSIGCSDHDARVHAPNESIRLDYFVKNMKKPVVATNIPGSTEAVVNGKTGFLIPPKAPEAMAEALLTLLGNRNLSRQMGEEVLKISPSEAQNYVLATMSSFFAEVLSVEKVMDRLHKLPG
jgi:hypothetical protein